MDSQSGHVAMSSRPAAGLAVDIVINNYNYGAFLEQAIESACGQTYDPVTVIVVDDGSTDDSRQILERNRSRVEVVLKENGGQASALNLGMEHCEGDVVLFLDADDVLDPDAASRVAASFAADPSVAKVQFRMDVIDAAGNPTGAVKPPSHLSMPSGDVRRSELAFPFDLTWLATSGNAFRSELLRRIFPIPEPEYRICADWYLVHLTALLGPVVSLEEIGASYRLHGANSYERQTSRLDLDHIRQTIGLAGSTVRELERLADELGLECPDPILSLWDLANRLISLRLDPDLHPVRGDSRHRLLADSVRAARRRFDVSATKRLMFVAWFAVTALAPRGLVPPLAELFLFSQRPAAVNRLLSGMDRANSQVDLAG